MASLSHSEYGYEFAFGDGLPVGHEVLAASQGDRPDTLAGFRRALEGLTQASDTESVASRTSINAEYGAHSLAASEGFWWAGTEALTHLQIASDADLVEFITWNTDQQRQFQTALDGVLEEIQLRSIESTGVLIAVKYMKPEQQELYKKTILRVGKIAALDGFEAAGMRVHGYCDGADRIALANQFADRGKFSGVTKSLAATAFHEYNHAYGAGHKAGYHWTPPGSRLLEEVTNAHITSVANDVQALPGVLNPNLRVSGIGGYDQEALLVSDIIRDDETVVRQMARSFFSSERTARQLLLTKLDASVKDTLGHVADSWSDLSAQYELTPRVERPVMMLRLIEYLCRQRGMAFELEDLSPSDLSGEVMRFLPDVNSSST